MRHTNTADCASDGDLVRAFAGGDASAFEALLMRHESSVYRICYLMTRSREDARDLCQEAFLLMYPNATRRGCSTRRRRNSLKRHATGWTLSTRASKRKPSRRFFGL